MAQWKFRRIERFSQFARGQGQVRDMGYSLWVRTASDKQLQSWLKRESETQELIKNVPGTVLGSRLRGARPRMGISIRDLAGMAHVSKHSIVRIESGGLPHVTTLLKVCGALGIHVASLAKPTDSENE